MIEMQALADRTRERAAQLGIDKFDISGSVVDETSAQVERGVPKQVKASNRAGVTVRVWNRQQRVGIASTTEFDPIGLELALKMAYEASAFGIQDHAPDFSPEALIPIPSLPYEPLPQAPIAQLVDTLLAAEKELLAAHPAIQGVPYNGMAQRDFDRFYLNSDGAVRSEHRSVSSIYLYSKAEEPDRKPRSAGAYRLSHRLSDLDVSGCVQETVEKTISHLNYGKVKTGKYTVVFSPEAFLSLVRAFSNLFNAQSVLDRQSLSSIDSLGKAIATPLLSLCDDPLHPANIGASTFDGEGTPTRRVDLIQKGVLTHFLHSAGTAKRMGTQPTGNANMGAKITVSPHFYHIFPGTPAPQAYHLDDADEVIWIDDLHALHAGVQALQGSFSLPFDGWMVRQGQRTSIESATVAGDFLSLLQSICYVDPEVKWTPEGVCPLIWVEGLSVTGD